MSAEPLQIVGRELVLACVSVLRTIQTHGSENEAARTGAQRLVSVLAANYQELGAMTLDVVDDMFLLNGTRLRPPSTMVAQYATLARELTARGVGGLAFRRALDIGAVLALFNLFVARPETPQQLTAIRDYIARHAPEGVDILDVRTMTASYVHDTLRGSTMAFAIHTYACAILAFREFVAALRNGRSPYANRLNVVRVVQDLIDAASSRTDLLLYAIQLEKARGVKLSLNYQEVHAANTCVYAILIGRMLELERTTLLDLGTSALLVDAASALVFDDQTSAHAGVLTPEQRQQLKEDVTRAVQLILGHDQGNDDAVLLRTIVAYEQHKPMTDAAAKETRPLHTLSRIVAVAGAWDAMTTNRPWRAAMSMEEALETLTRESGKKFDPLIVGTLGALLTAYFSGPASQHRDT